MPKELRKFPALRTVCMIECDRDGQHNIINYDIATQMRKHNKYIKFPKKTSRTIRFLDNVDYLLVKMLTIWIDNLTLTLNIIDCIININTD